MLSEADRRAHKKRYLNLVQEHRCVQCGKSDERTLSGRTRCVECFAKQCAKPQKPKTPEQRAITDANKKAWKELRRKNHLCTECGEKDAFTLNGRALCAVCANKAAVRRRKSYAKNPEPAKERARRYTAERAAAGLCTICGKKKADEGFKTCIDCRVRGRLKAARKRARNRAKAGVINNWPRGANGYCWCCNKEKVMDGKRVCKGCHDRLIGYITTEDAEKGRETQRELWNVRCKK